MWTSLVAPIADIIGKVVEDKDKANEIAYKINTLAEKQAHEIALAQIEVNKVEAQSPSLFKSGWRPAVSWLCVFAMGWHFIIQPVVVFIMVVMGHDPIDLPEFDMGSLMTVLMGLLGLGGLRSYEKTKGLTK